MRPVCLPMIFLHYILSCPTIVLRINIYNLWCCQKVCEALTFLLDNIYIRLGSKLYPQIVGIPMGTSCAPLVADLFLFCNERNFTQTEELSV